MKLFVHGMQSSGASLFAYFLSQRTETLGIIDLNNHRLAPALDYPFDIVLKAVITTRWSLAEHIDSFHPERKILFIRNPYDNYYSLKDKVYADKSGGIDEKFALLEACFLNQDRYDATIYFEDFISRHAETVAKLNKISWGASLEHYNFPRGPRDIYAFNMIFCEWCRNNPAAPGPEGGWGMGNIRDNKINLALRDKPFDASVDEKVRQLCPALYEYYRETRL